MATVTPSPMVQLTAIAVRDGLSISEVDILIQHWCRPAMWEYNNMLDLAFTDGSSWQNWRAHHDELLRLGYYAKG